MKDKIKLKTVSPVYVVINREHVPVYMLLLVVVNGIYGAYKLPLIRHKDSQVTSGNEWPYRIRRSKNRIVIEILKDINLMGGHIKIKENWKSKYVLCNDDKLPLILDWIKFLNNKAKKGIK